MTTLNDTVSIIIITFNERQSLLQKCLESISISLKEVSLNHEIIIVNNDTTLIPVLPTTNLKTQIISTPNVSPAEARNRGVLLAKGEWVLFLDDDVELPKDYLKKSISFISQRPLDLFGGPDRAHPVANILSKSYSIVLENPFIMGPTIFRHSSFWGTLLNPPGAEWSLILCHLWARTKLFKAEGFAFKENYMRNEENVLIRELKCAQKIIAYEPNLYVFHNRKDSFEKIVHATYSSGFHRGKMLQIASHEFIYLLAPITLVAHLSFKFAATYLIINLITNVLISKEVSPRTLLVSLITIYVMLISYSAGIVRSLLKRVSSSFF